MNDWISCSSSSTEILFCFYRSSDLHLPWQCTARWQKLTHTTPETSTPSTPSSHYWDVPGRNLCGFQSRSSLVLFFLLFWNHHRQPRKAQEPSETSQLSPDMKDGQRVGRGQLYNTDPVYGGRTVPPGLWEPRLGGGFFALFWGEQWVLYCSPHDQWKHIFTRSLRPILYYTRTVLPLVLTVWLSYISLHRKSQKF